MGRKEGHPLAPEDPQVDVGLRIRPLIGVATPRGGREDGGVPRTFIGPGVGAHAAKASLYRAVEMLLALEQPRLAGRPESNAASQERSSYQRGTGHRNRSSGCRQSKRNRPQSSPLRSARKN